MKRFTETTKWDDPWFRGLKPPEKLLFLFVVDNCNNAGFYETDMGAIIFKTGMTEAQILGAIKGLVRGILGADGWLWVRRFLRHQKNEELNPENNAHKQIIGLINDQRSRFAECPEFQSFLAPNQGLFSPIGKGTGTVKEERGMGKTRFQPPNLDEWLTRADELGYPRPDAEQAYHSYDAKGWKVGNTPMSKWRAAIQTCHTKWKMSGSNGSKPERKVKMV